MRWTMPVCTMIINQVLAVDERRLMLYCMMMTQHLSLHITLLLLAVI